MNDKTQKTLEAEVMGIETSEGRDEFARSFEEENAEAQDLLYLRELWYCAAQRWMNSYMAFRERTGGLKN